jgi:hypothetical protein
MRRRLAGVVTALLLVGLAPACGSDASAQEIVTRAADATIAESTAKVALSVVITGNNLPDQKLTLDAEGVIDFAGKRTAMTMDLGDSLAGAGIAAADSTMELITEGSVIYMRSPLFSQGGAISADKWLKLDLTELSKTEGLDLGQLQQAGNNDPRQGLAFLEGATKDGVETVGSEPIRGVETTHYRAEIDLEDAIEQSGAVTDPEAFRKFVDALGTKTITVDTWIDDDNRVRRVSIPMPMPTSTDGEAKMTMDYFDFGTEARITVPAPEEVVDFSELGGS